MITHDTRWCSDSLGRISALASFGTNWDDFEETPLFVQTAIEHNARIEAEQFLCIPQRWILGVDVATDADSITMLDSHNGRLWVIPDEPSYSVMPASPQSSLNFACASSNGSNSSEVPISPATQAFT